MQFVGVGGKIINKEIWSIKRSSFDKSFFCDLSIFPSKSCGIVVFMRKLSVHGLFLLISSIELIYVLGYIVL